MFNIVKEHDAIESAMKDLSFSQLLVTLFWYLPYHMRSITKVQIGMGLQTIDLTIFFSKRNVDVRVARGAFSKLQL